jgi:hypothetical protein
MKESGIKYLVLETPTPTEILIAVCKMEIIGTIVSGFDSECYIETFAVDSQLTGKVR